MRRIKNRSSRNFLKTNKPNESQVKLNEKITANKLVVIDENGTRIGVMNRTEALQLAESKELDLLVVSDQGETPVARIVNYEKYRYEKQKKQKSNQKRQSSVRIKEVTFRPNIGVHDLEIKANKAAAWLKNGDNVKVLVYAPGRLMNRGELTNAVYNQFIEFVGFEVKVLKPLTRTTPTYYESMISDGSAVKSGKIDDRI